MNKEAGIIDGTRLSYGNAKEAGTDYREWFTGPFVSPEAGLRCAPVEAKWSPRPEGWVRGWSAPATGTTLQILISGAMALHFSGAENATVVLDEPGDYVMWGPGIAHDCLALQDCVVLTIRWPSE